MNIRQPVLDEMIAHALEDLPNECCGLLIGTAEFVEELARARNAKGSPTEFEVEPQDHFAAIRRARATGREVVGAYHSHPRGPSAPSATDRARLNDESMVHIIISLADGGRSVRAFRFKDGNFNPLELVPVP